MGVSDFLSTPVYVACSLTSDCFSTNYQTPRYILTIFILVCSTHIDLLLCPASIVQGTNGTISCQSDSSNPKSNITVLVNGNQVENNHIPVYEESDYHGFTTKIDYLTNILSKNDTGIEFRCCIQNQVVNCPTEVCSSACKPEIYCKYHR